MNLFISSDTTVAAISAASDALLPKASTFAIAIDHSFEILVWFSVFVVTLVGGGLALWMIASRNSRDESTSPATQSPWPMRVCTFSCVGLIAAVFVHGSYVWADMQVAPRGALPIKVSVGEKGFAFTYPNGYVATLLHLPLDRPVRLLFKSSSEPYSFDVPAFRLQVPIAANEDRDAWVQATLAGEYDVRSTVRLANSPPDATALVHDAGGFDKWYQDISGPPLDLPPIELGQRSYQMRGCTQCHTVDGSKLVGPSFKGFLAREHKLKDGTIVEPTDDYIRESIQDPTAKVIDGFEPVMPSFKGRFSDTELNGLVAYVKSLK